MDKTLRDIHAQLNAHNALLQTLYIHAYKGNQEELKTLRDDLIAQIQKPIRHPNLIEQEVATEIQPQTASAVWVFFQEVLEHGSQEGLTE